METQYNKTTRKTQNTRKTELKTRAATISRLVTIMSTIKFVVDDFNSRCVIFCFFLNFVFLSKLLRHLPLLRLRFCP